MLEVVIFSPREPGERVNEEPPFVEGLERCVKREESRIETWRGLLEEGVGEQ